MTDSPREARQAAEETIDQRSIAGGSTEQQTTGEAGARPPAGGSAGEAEVPARVRIPGYEVLGLLGKGGMGVVYKARQASLDRIVALKMILHAEHAGSAERQRFQAEAEAAARLQHPHIVQVFEVGTHDGLPFLTLEYCPGGSLAQRLDGTPWPIREAAHLVETLADAAQAAHAARVVHRDLNPANVLLTATGQPKITDFGLAKKLGEQGRTQTGAVVGTPSYMAPEQASGKAKEVGPAADIYALGAILYELLTGRPPFKAATPLDTILQVAASEPAAVRRLRPQVPRDLETICHKCLEKSPAKRYASADALAADLRHFLAGEPIRARPISRWERGVKWAKRRPAATIAAATSATALLCLIILIAVLWRRGRQPVEALPDEGRLMHRELEAKVKQPENMPIMPPAPEAKVPADQSKPPAKPNIWERLQIATGIMPVTQPKQSVPPVKLGDEKDATNGRLSGAKREQIKRATVFVRVTHPDGQVAMGSGFFGSAEFPNILLAAAHVVGPFVPDRVRLPRIEVFVNSGETDEWMTQARLLGVDRDSDLAVLDIGTPPVGKIMPKPLTVKSGAQLRELDEVYMFGFLPGNQVGGKEIMIRPATVSALRKKESILDRIQINGGMVPGSAGGPVVDNTGSVVGLIQGVLAGQPITVAVSGDRMRMMLIGRFTALHVAQPYYVSGVRVAVPVRMEMLDPLNVVGGVVVEVWTGDKPLGDQEGKRPASTTRPAAREGDSPHTPFLLTYAGGEGKGDLVLPDLPAGKVYWQQPQWVDASGQAHWGEAGQLHLPGAPVHRRPVNLTFHLPPDARQSVKLTLVNELKMNYGPAVLIVHTEVESLETVREANVLSLQYRLANRTTLDSQGRKHPDSIFDKLKTDLPRLAALLRLDPRGGVLKREPDLSGLGDLSQQRIKELRDFDESSQKNQEILSVPLPAQSLRNPRDSWKATRPLPIEAGKLENGKLDMTYTYLGVRKNRDREEAVIDMVGLVRTDRGGGDAIDGRAAGTAVVDVASGQTIQSDVSLLLPVEVESRTEGKEPTKVKLISTMKMKLERGP